MVSLSKKNFIMPGLATIFSLFIPKARALTSKNFFPSRLKIILAGFDGLPEPTNLEPRMLNPPS